MPKRGSAGRGDPETRGDRRAPLRLEQRLVLNQWLLDLFGVRSIERLTANLKASGHEGFDEDNSSRFHPYLMLMLDRESPLRDSLPAYDRNIVRHWLRITEKRKYAEPHLYPKHFQYLALLFAEVYLDRHFRDPDGLLGELNARVDIFNRGEHPVRGMPDGSVPKGDRIDAYTKEDLNKIAFWMATGSGKTLLMHVNILQYRHYLDACGGKQVNRFILLTPNEGLSRQHLEEFWLSGIDAELFSKEGRSLFAGQGVEIIDIHKLRDEMGEKTIAVEAFEGNNLVLVDEGHRGASGAKTGAWIRMRNRLCEHGFSFEYSATFGQATRIGGGRELDQVYAKCILFDYSYRHFYADGYGKDYRILNLADDSDRDIRREYLIACLLCFHQQLKLHQERAEGFRPFLLERPLWVFVGGSVNAVRTQNGGKVSDVTDILLSLESFVRERGESVASIGRLLDGRSGLLDGQRRKLFRGAAFRYLNTLGLTPEEVFDDILRTLFNAPAAAALHVEHLRGTDGEVALRLGGNDVFGVVNVGDASALCKLCGEQEGLIVTEGEFSGSLFRSLNDAASTVNILIGSKKFTEGWSSWRVSTMGLMNIGRNEGPQIIQLFGRGVRLKGRGFSLKRSSRLGEPSTPKDIETLETLNIFGIRADYMRQFKEYLDEEDLPANEDQIEFVLPVVKNLGGKKLKTIRLRKGIDHKRDGYKPVLDAPPDHLLRHPIVVDWYPKLQTIASNARSRHTPEAEREQHHLDEQHLAFLDLDTIYFELQRFKNERAWHNIVLPRTSPANLLARTDWYTLFIPKEEMLFRSFRQVLRWQEIATVLLKKFMDRHYKLRRQEFERDHLEYQELSEDDPNFIDEYRLLVEQSREDIVCKLEEIKRLIGTGKLRNVEFQSLHAVAFERHLYEPLIYAGNELTEIRPIVLENEGERDFVLDLQAFCEAKRDVLEGKELYLLRNMSRGRGVGFFDAGNFYPDFILWLLDDGHQYVSFIDPKGLRNLEGPNDPKIRFSQTIKDLECQLGDPTVILNSFIVSSTRAPDVAWWDNEKTKSELEARNVLFQREDRGTYIEKLLRKMGASEGAG